MTIDKIGGVGGLQPSSNIKHVDKSAGIGTDKVEISNEAKLALEQEQLLEITLNAPEIRQDKVLEAKARLEMYMKDEALKEKVLMSMAESLTDAIFSKEVEE